MSIEFAGQRQFIGHTVFGDFPGFEPQPLRVGPIHDAQKRIADWIDKIPADTVVLERQEYMGVPETGLASSFVSSPGLGEGRDMSQHEVDFGQLVVKSVTDQPLPTVVAIKPYREETESDDYDGLADPRAPEEILAHEWVMLEALNCLGDDQRSYLPLGVWRDEEGTPQLVTLFEHRVASLDTLFWSRGEEANQITDLEIIRGFSLAFWGLGSLHGAGFLVDDPVVRNFGDDTTHARLIDGEGLQLAPRTNGTHLANTDTTRRMFRQDMTRLLSSAVTRLALDDDGQPYQLESALFDKVVPIINDPDVQDWVYRHYYFGIQEGKKRSGLNANDTLYPEFAKFVRAIKFATTLELITTGEATLAELDS